MNHFFAYMARMKYIQRWGLMRSVQPENIQEHSLQVAMIAHCLALVRREIFGGTVDAEHIMALAVYHDVSEVITGDLATPIKYFNPEIKEAYDKIEHVAADKLLQMLPSELQPSYRELLISEEMDKEEYRLVKAADKLSAYLKCLEEIKAGNQEFVRAEQSIRNELKKYGLAEVDYFLEHFVSSFNLTLDELD